MGISCIKYMNSRWDTPESQYKSQTA